MRKGVTRERKVRRGMDREKLVRIWRALEGAKAEREGWLHVADIARRTGINPVTVRWYLDHYLDQAIEEQQLLPGIRLRLVRLKPGYDLLGYLKARESIRNIKGV